MGLAALIARRSLLRRPGRSLFSILGIAVGVATVVGVVTLDHATIEGYARVRQVADRPDIELTAAGGVAGTTEDIASLEGISAASRFFRNEVLLERPGAEPARDAAPLRVPLVAIEAEYASSRALFGVAEGLDLDPEAATPEVLVGEALARDEGVGVGETIVLSRPPRVARTRCENGVLVEVETGEVDRPPALEFVVAGVLTRQGVGRTSGGNVVIVRYGDGEALFRGTKLEPRFWATKDPGVDLERLRRSLAASYSYSLNKGIVVGQSADERAFRMGVRMLGLLALVLGLYVIFHTLSMSLTERVTEVGTLHALGSSRGQIGRVFFTEAVLLSGAGAVGGAAIGVLLAFAATRAGVTTLGVGKTVVGFAVPWTNVAALTALGFAIALVGSVYPLVAIGGANTLRALRGEESVRRADGGASARRFQLVYALLLAFLVPGLYLVLVPVVSQMTGELVATLLGAIGVMTVVVLLSLLLPAFLAGLCAVLARPLTRLFPFAGSMASRALSDAPARIGVSACAIALVVAGFVGLHGMTASLRGEVVAWSDEAVVDKVWVSSLPPTDFDALSAHLMHYPGVVGVEKGSARQYAPFLVIGTTSRTMGGYGPFAADPALAERFETERTMVLSRRLARDLDYAVGDLVKMKGTGGEVLEFEVIAISDAYGYWTRPDERMYGTISDRWMRSDFCVGSEVVDQVAVRFDRNAPMAEEGHVGVLAAALRDLHPEAPLPGIRTGLDVRAYALADIGRDFIVFDLLLGAMAALAALGVLNGMLLATLERFTELGLLKALGASRGQVGGAMALEATVVGLVGGALGVVVGLAALPVAIGALDRLAGLDLRVVSPGAWIPASLVGAVVVALLSSLYPIRRAHTADAVRAVRTKS